MAKKNIAKICKLVLDDFTKINIVMFRREMSILTKLDHPSILKLSGYSLTNFKNKSKPIILMDPTSTTTLYDYLFAKGDSELSDTKKLITIYGIASGMSYLHSHNILHCDLNPKNIFFISCLSNFDKQKTFCD